MSVPGVNGRSGALSTQHRDDRIVRGRRPTVLGDRRIVAANPGGKLQTFQRKTAAEVALTKPTSNQIPASKIGQKRAVDRAANDIVEYQEPTRLSEATKKVGKCVKHPILVKGCSGFTLLGATYLLGGFHWAAQTIKDAGISLWGNVADAAHGARDAAGSLAGSATEEAAKAAGEVTGLFTGTGGAALGTGAILTAGGMAYVLTELTDLVFEGKGIGARIGKAVSGACIGTLAGAATTGVLVHALGSVGTIYGLDIQPAPVMAAVAGNVLLGAAAGYAANTKTAAAVSTIGLLATAASAAALGGEAAVAAVPGTAVVAALGAAGVGVAGALVREVVNHGSDLINTGKTLTCASAIFAGIAGSTVGLAYGYDFIREPAGKIIVPIAQFIGSLVSGAGTGLTTGGKYVLTTLKVAEAASAFGSYMSSFGSAIVDAGSSVLTAIAPTVSKVGTATAQSTALLVGAGVAGGVGAFIVDQINGIKTSGGIDRVSKAIGAAGAGALIGASVSGALSGIGVLFGDSKPPAEYSYLGIVGALGLGTLAGIGSDSPKAAAATTAALTVGAAISLAAEGETLLEGIAQAAGISLTGLGLGAAAIAAGPVVYGSAHAIKASAGFMLECLESTIRSNKNKPRSSATAAPAKKPLKNQHNTDGAVEVIDYVQEEEQLPEEYGALPAPSLKPSRKPPSLTGGREGRPLSIGAPRQSRREPLKVQGRRAPLLKRG